MKNKLFLKKCLIKILIVSLISLILFLLINIYEYHIYTVNYNNKISQIISALNEKYPLLTEKEIIEILNSDNSINNKIFEKYGIDLNKESIVIENDKNYYNFLFINVLFVILLIIVIVFIFLQYNKKKEKDIKDITNYIEQINKKNYELQIDSISEDELSILKNEIYKTTIMLKEAAENSNLDKMNLKNSLEDISHQLKTPLTSILIMLDNLLDDENMEKEIKNDFIRDIRREVISINFLVQSVLKLSKFDANTITFIKENINPKQIVEEAIKKVSVLCDLKNISIKIITNNNSSQIYCDLRWEIEAITNILKNCIEHSKNDSVITVEIKSNKIYNSIIISDNGEGIDEKDLPHIFKRFYKGKNSSKDSVGIGLALAKTIIEKDNGTITVESSKGKNTTFTIKYY